MPALAGFVLFLAATPPTVAPVHAEFVASEFATHYTVNAEDASGKTLTFQWRLIPPTADPGCDHFTSSGNSAVWHHGDQDGCNHNVQVAQGHPGTVIVVVGDGEFSCTATYFGTITGNGPGPSCSALAQATPSAATTPSSAAVPQSHGIPAWQIGLAIIVFIAVAGVVAWFLLARRDPCDELRDRCRELQAQARAAAARAGAARAAAAAAQKACDDARKVREKAEQRIKAASGEGGSWIEGSEHPGERLTSHDLQLQAQYEASVRAQLQSGDITEAQAQEMLSHWGDPAQWNRLRKEEKDRAESDLAAAGAAESAACAEADRLRMEANAAAAAADAAQKTAGEACAAADECEKARREQAAAAAAAPPAPAAVTPPPTPTTVSPPAVVSQPPPPPTTHHKPDCEDGEERTEVRCETEVDMYALGEMTLKIGSNMMFSQEDVDSAISGFEHALVVIDLGTLAVSSLGGAPLAVGTWIAGKAGFPSFDTITSLPQDAALGGLRRLNDIVRERRYTGDYQFFCNRYHLKARCEVKYVCRGGSWVVTERKMTVEPVGPAQAMPGPVIQVDDPQEAPRAIRTAAGRFRTGNRSAQQKLDDCAKKCQR